MTYLRFISVVLLLCLVPQLLLADQIVLRSGDTVVGNVANREEVEDDPLALEAIGILVTTDGKSHLLRFPLDDIEYVVLERGGEQRVIDIVGLRGRQTGRSMLSEAALRKSDSRRQAIGGGLLAGGAALAAFGAVKKFGEEEAKITASGVDVERTYNSLNYALMIGGGVVALLGLVMITTAERYPPPSRGSLNLKPNGMTYLSFSYRF